MKTLLIEKLHELAVWPFQKWRNSSIQWSDISIGSLLQYPEGTLGFNLGCFLIRNNFELQPKFEDHDVMHVLTGIGTSIPEEIGMHYYMAGNGKRSFYSLVYITIGTLFYPFYISSFLGHYKKGRQAFQFHDLEFIKLLPLPIQKIQYAFKIN